MARIKRIQPKTAQDDSKALKEENLKLKAVIVHLEAKVDELQEACADLESDNENIGFELDEAEERLEELKG